MERIYLDHNATTPLDPRAFAAMLPLLRGVFGNASSTHGHGLEARRTIEDARARVAAHLDAQDDEIVFTSGGTEANSLVIHAAVHQHNAVHVIVSAIEHSSVLDVCRALRERGQIELSIVGVDANGRVSPANVARELRPTTRLISIMAANNETGAVQSLRPIGKLARACGAAFHCDATQLCGKGRVTPAAWLADYVSLSAHKFYGPKGAGVLYRKRGAPWWTPVFGGRQEHGIRPGTENVAAIAGLAEALEHADDPREWEQVRELRQRLWSGIADIPDVLLNTTLEASVGNTLNVSFRGLSSDALTLALDLRGISVSGGSACYSGAGAPSHVLLAMGRTPDEAHSAIRFSVGRSTTSTEIDLVVEHVTTCVTRLRASRSQQTYALRGARAS